MKLFAFSDIHRDLEAVRAIGERAFDADILVGAGDFATMRQGLQPVIDAIADLGVRTLLVHGNGESAEELAQACDPHAHVTSLHGTGIEIDGYHFFGLGAAVPVTPFGSWSVDLTEEEAESLLATCPNGAVLISHSPPKGACDVSSSSQSIGSEAVRRCIEEKLPTHVLCGHVHDSWGSVETVGSTRVMNLGPKGALIEL
ncbi:MAG: metallophosphoesterase family protein [Planctomycetota bacterium]